MSSIPDGFGSKFLDWFRAHTEAYWASIPDATPEETLTKYVNWRVGGCSWQHGTKWLNGLSDEQLDTVEARWSIRFPPEYRLFLRRLHTVDKPKRCARYIGHEEATAPGTGYLATAFVHEPKQYMTLGEGPSFYDWMHGTDSIRDVLENIVDGLIFDVENNVLWPESWGAKPGTAEEREERVRELVSAAPKLIPVYAHGFLLGEPCEAGNPVFSIMQSDIIVYGADLHDYFLIESGEMFAPDERDAVKAAKARISDILRYEPIPFWGELLFV
jgi:hypothetical protein